jgi:2',3'-cyclic-nucleotide 2'-phosphodiesterase/3'-nucleotidase
VLFRSTDSTVCQNAGLDGNNIVLAAPDGTREILAKWLESKKQISVADLEPTSWNFAPLKTRGAVVFTDASGKQAVAREAGLDNIRQLKDHGDGTATYAIDLSR